MSSIELKKGDKVLLTKYHRNYIAIVTFVSSGTMIMVRTIKDGDEFPTDLKHVKLKMNGAKEEKKARFDVSKNKIKRKEKIARIEKQRRIAEIRRRNKLKNKD